MKNKVLIGLLILGSTILHAQHQVIAASGNCFNTSSGSIAFTLGEPVIGTYSGLNNTLTQGFHQTRLSIVSLTMSQKKGFIINVYPNPATEYINLKVDMIQDIRYELYDLRGMLIATKQVDTDETEIPVGKLKPSIYLLKIFKGSQELQIVKIVKR
jgi:hypothetical protein